MPSWLGRGGVTAATSGRPRACWLTVAARSAEPGPSTSTTSGPVTPGPNRSDRIWAARAWVVPAASGCTSVVRIDATGIASTPSATTAATRLSQRRVVTKRAQPAQKPRSRRGRRRSIRRPTKPSTAGTSVSASSTATTTVAAAARPISVRNGMPATTSPASAMTTVMPAVSTAEPAVPTAVATASPTSRPRSSSCRNRVKMNSA